jgi:hypothetical protein
VCVERSRVERMRRKNIRHPLRPRRRPHPDHQRQHSSLGHSDRPVKRAGSVVSRRYSTPCTGSAIEDVHWNSLLRQTIRRARWRPPPWGIRWRVEKSPEGAGGITSSSKAVAGPNRVGRWSARDRPADSSQLEAPGRFPDRRDARQVGDLGSPVGHVRRPRPRSVRAPTQATRRVERRMPRLPREAGRGESRVIAPCRTRGRPRLRARPTPRTRRTACRATEGTSRTWVLLDVRVPSLVVSSRATSPVRGGRQP